MTAEWFKPRPYKHFDLPVDESFAAKVVDPSFVSRHAFSPLIHYDKIDVRYKKDPKSGIRKIVRKPRPIKYASHRDACILSYYSYLLSQALASQYGKHEFGESVIAYRALGRSNYHFSAEALAFAVSNAPVMILAFDVTGFFDNLDHGLLKRRLKSVLNVTSLSSDWHKVLRFVTRFHFVRLDVLQSHPVFGPRHKEKGLRRIASVKELKEASIAFEPNPEITKVLARGIPQGTPISASLSNLYMIDFDAAAASFCSKIGALYRRYSDDILVICKVEQAGAAEAEILRLIAAERLEIAAHKTEKTLFNKGVSTIRTSKAAQYLGFTFDESGAAIRESSLARQWRKMRRAIKRTRAVAMIKIAGGKSNKVHTKRLYRRFTFLKVNNGDSIRALRNFSSYGRRSAEAFDNKVKILSQIRRFENAALRELAELKKIWLPPPPATP